MALAKVSKLSAWPRKRPSSLVSWPRTWLLAKPWVRRSKLDLLTSARPTATCRVRRRMPARPPAWPRKRPSSLVLAKRLAKVSKPFRWRSRQPSSLGCSKALARFIKELNRRKQPGLARPPRRRPLKWALPSRWVRSRWERVSCKGLRQVFVQAFPPFRWVLRSR